MKIDRQTPISLDLVITFLVAAFSLGILWFKVDDVRGDVVEVKKQVLAIYELLKPERSAAK